MGIAADETALDRFEAFHAILDEYNARMDLTAVLDEDERVDRHDLDSAAPLAHGLLMPGAKVIDVGTGAGFPGMPLLILRPDLQMTFLDALNKRILFLEDALARLGLKSGDAARARGRRSQNGGAPRTIRRGGLPCGGQRGDAGRIDASVCFKRAAWRLPGRDRAWRKEMTAARRAAFLLGGTVRGMVDAPIPGRDDWAHVLLLTDKTGTTPKAYPRKAGTPNRKPLGQ